MNTFDYADPDQERRDWVQALRPGDRVQLYALAMYPGWQNFVQRAEITIRYHEVTREQGTEDDSIEDLPETHWKPKPLEQNPREPPPYHEPKVVIYHQSLHMENGILTFLRPLVQQKTGITAVILGNFRLYWNCKETPIPALDHEGSGRDAVFLNQYALDDSSIAGLWADIEYLQREDIKIIALLSFCRNDRTSNNDCKWLGSCDDSAFERCYELLHDLVVSRGLDGINLDTDVSENSVNTEKGGVTLEGLTRLIDRLHADFGSRFTIVLTASVESLLSTETSRKGHGIDYRALELQRGHLISWYNVPIFSCCTHGNDQKDKLRAPASHFVRELNSYIHLLHDEVYRAHRILLAISTSPDLDSQTLKERGACDSLRAFSSCYVGHTA